MQPGTTAAARAVGVSGDAELFDGWVATLERVEVVLAQDALALLEAREPVCDPRKRSVALQRAQHLVRALDRRLQPGVGVEGDAGAHRCEIGLRDLRGASTEDDVDDLGRGQLTQDPSD